MSTPEKVNQIKQIIHEKYNQVNLKISSKKLKGVNI